MPPPPIPVDPALDPDATSWNRNTFPYGFEHVLPPVGGLFPPLLEKPAYPYQIGNNSEISPQDLQLPCTRQNDIDTSPIARFYGEPGPWNAQKVVADVGPQSSTLAFPGLSPELNRFPMSQIQPRSCDRSEVGSSTTGRNPQDSGYDSKSYATKSVRSFSEYIDRSQDCQSLAGDVGDLQMHPGHPGDQFQGQGPESLQDESHPYGMNDGPASHGQLVCPYPECKNTTFKNQSDQK